MIVSHLRLRNWRNFQQVDVPLRERMFLAGPNASGKSNLLDVFRFLRDIAKPGGGLQTAVEERGGLSKIRCLAAKRFPQVEVEIHLAEAEEEEPTWRYAIGLKQEVRGHHKPYLAHERVWHKEKEIVSRPEKKDRDDELRLTQTYLEQINSNSKFRPVSKYFNEVLYLHLVPQLLRHPDYFTGPGIPGDPFGRNFLERMAKTPQKTRRARLRKIEAALQIAVPQLKGLTDAVDERGVPHLEATYEHWRSRGAKQREDQFSDGTLRMIGLFWSLLESDSLLLLEEPELSLNTEIVRRLPGLMYKVQQKHKRQILISTHSEDLLQDTGITAEEVLFLEPESEGTRVVLAADAPGIVDLVKGGLSVGEAIMPRTSPKDARQLSLIP
ncbi:MAG: AAA family ATPase [Deltaproteobacteria bacterium]|nr:AAA family ATPase [Deltaproteobacteria bacterium]